MRPGQQVSCSANIYGASSPELEAIVIILSPCQTKSCQLAGGRGHVVRRPFYRVVMFQSMTQGVRGRADGISPSEGSGRTLCRG